MKKHNHKRFNRTSPKSEKSSKEVKSPSATTLNGSTHKPTTPDSDRAYFKSNKPKLPKELEEETRRKRFMEKECEY